MEAQFTKLIIPFRRCEFDRRIEIECTEEAFELLIEILRSTGAEIETQEERLPRDDLGTHRLRAALQAVCEVQGMKLIEGESITPAIESLVAKYAALK